MARPLRVRSALSGSTLVEHRPGRRVARAVICTWVGDPATSRRVQVLPDGSADLVWTGTRLRVAGAGVCAVEHAVSAASTGLRLRIGAVGAVLGVPAHELAPSGVDLEAVWGTGARVWERRLLQARHVGETRALLEELVTRRLVERAPDPLVQAAVTLLSTGHTVEATAHALACSEREMRRRFHRDVGPGPKALHRVVRFDRFRAHLHVLATGAVSLAGLAPALGYADQAHLTRECRAIVGATPKQVVARWVRHG